MGKNKKWTVSTAMEWAGQRSPREVLAVSWVALSVVQHVQSRVRGGEGAQQRQEEEEAAARVVKVRDKTFTQSSDSRYAVDLSMFGTLPFYLPSVAHALHIWEMLRNARNPRYNALRPTMRMMWALFALLPALDVHLSDWSNPTVAEGAKHSRRDRFRWPLYAWTAVELLGTLATFRTVFDPKSPLRTVDKAALLFVNAFVGGAWGITVAHELGHKRDMLERVMAQLLLVNTNYCHWMEEHNHGHHATVATPEDPATCKLGQGPLSFLPQTLLGTVASSWRVERERLRKTTGSSSPWTLRNRFLLYVGAPVLWSLVLRRVAHGNKWAVPAFFLGSLGGASLLELVNAVEHYGLQRTRYPDGSYEPVTPSHSWDCEFRLSNTVLFKLQRHSDHHTFASRPYQLLRVFREAARMPQGYPGMIVMYLFFPYFRFAMDDLVRANRAFSEALSHGDAGALAQATQNLEEAKSQAKIRTQLFSYAFLAACTVGMGPLERVLRGIAG